MLLLLKPLHGRSVSYRRLCHSCKRKYTSSSSADSSSFWPSALRKLPAGPARTRFAPSPTGYLHLGSLRTALFNYLLAKSTGGQFLLRIEDTDQKRTVPDAEDRLCQDLEWAGLEWDEGPKIGGPFGPYKQSQRTALYREHAEMLLHSGHAYRCFCSPERLHALAKQRTALGLPTDYDRTCTHVSAEESEDRASKGEAHVIRFKIPQVSPPFTDLVYGKARHRQDQSQTAQLYPAFEDPIILKSDGFPTYHLANVVDDHHMKITHVVRGAEWMSSTPKHLAMYDALCWEPPAFAHVGLLTDKDRQKLSKRNLDLDISAFRDKLGIFPETLTNFVALLGWSHDQRKDIMNLRELVENFSMKLTTGDIVVTFGKLWYLQRAHAERYAKSETRGRVSKMSLMIDPIMVDLKERNSIDDHNLILSRHNADSYLPKLLRVDARNYTNAPAFVQRNRYFFETPDRPTLSASCPSFHLHHVPANLPTAVKAEQLSGALSNLDRISPEDWTAETIRTCVNRIIGIKVEESLDEIEDSQLDIEATREVLNKSWSKLIHQYIRWAIAAGIPGPDGAKSMEILGKQETMARLVNAANVGESEGYVSEAGNPQLRSLPNVRWREKA